MTLDGLPLKNNKKRIAASACSKSSKAIKIKVSILVRMYAFFVLPFCSFIAILMTRGLPRAPYSDTTQSIGLYIAGFIMFAWVLNLVYRKWLQIDIASKEYLVKISLFFIPMGTIYRDPY